MIGLFYFNGRQINNDAFDQKVISASGAKYTIEVDPSVKYSDKTFYEKAIMFLFSEKINQGLESKGNNAKPAGGMIHASGQVAKIDDKVTIIFHKTNPLPLILPSPVEVVVGSSTLPPELNKALAGMHIGQRREYAIGSNLYDVMLLQIH